MSEHSQSYAKTVSIPVPKSGTESILGSNVSLHQRCRRASRRPPCAKVCKPCRISRALELALLSSLSLCFAGLSLGDSCRLTEQHGGHLEIVSINAFAIAHHTWRIQNFSSIESIRHCLHFFCVYFPDQ